MKCSACHHKVEQHQAKRTPDGWAPGPCNVNGCPCGEFVASELVKKASDAWRSEEGRRAWNRVILGIA